MLVASPVTKGVQFMTKKFSLATVPDSSRSLRSLFLALPQNAAAQDQDPGQDPAQAQVQIVDPPTRVARLNYVQGSVSFQPAGEQDWLEADINRPLTTGDNLWADKDSRGEIHIGATSIRLSSETGISFLNLDDRTVQLQLAQGTIEVHVRRLEPGNAFEIDTPNLAFTLAASGEYRIQTDPDGNSTAITVREGAGQVTGAGESYDLTAGQQYIFNGTDQLSFNAQAAPEFDDFEDWCQAQDQRENSSASARYVSRDVDGYYDLDGNGDWQTDPDYGAIWVPERRCGWLGAVSLRPLGLDWAVGLDVGGRRAVGLRAISLRALGVCARRILGMGAGADGGASGVRAGAGGICRRTDSESAWDLAQDLPAWRGFRWGRAMFTFPGYRASPRYVQNINVTNTRVVNVDAGHDGVQQLRREPERGREPR